MRVMKYGDKTILDGKPLDYQGFSAVSGGTCQVLGSGVGSLVAIIKCF